MAEFLQRQLVAFAVEFFETVETIETLAHDLTGVRDTVELLAHFQ